MKHATAPTPYASKHHSRRSPNWKCGNCSRKCLQWRAINEDTKANSYHKQICIHTITTAVDEQISLLIDIALQTAFQHRAGQLSNNNIPRPYSLCIGLPFAIITVHLNVMIVAENQRKCVLAKACRARTSVYVQKTHQLPIPMPKTVHDNRSLHRAW
jgi:hypothetical protein